MSGRLRVFIASSLDGFIAGPDDDLSWLPQPSSEPGGDFGYGAFMAEVGALLMGRRTFDVVLGFGGEWPYGERPVLVTTHRPLPSSAPASARAVSGSITELVEAAREAAGGRDVYIDGGDLIRQALDAELIDELVVTLIPVILGAGHPLFAGAQRRHALELIEHTAHAGGLISLRYRGSAGR
ncbi:MAG TPA: dihydrofolate reductase family protein [Enhygromyxa sp.]|nr:dihydrofolate reductase family protein [Enhygromyxa sp.]